jgi:hypothetical protein
MLAGIEECNIVVRRRMPFRYNLDYEKRQSEIMSKTGVQRKDW